MRIFKSISKKLVTFALAFSMVFPTAGLTAIAATAPDAVETYTYKNGGYYYTGTRSGAPIIVKYDEAGDVIKNLKSSSDKLRVYTVYNSKSDKEGRIGTWSETPGTYKVDFDVCSADGTVKEHKTVTVKVSYYTVNKGPIKKLTYAGKDIFKSDFYDMIDLPSSGKLSITANKNYKIDKIMVGTLPKNAKSSSQEEYKFVKKGNNKTIKLGKYPYKYSYSYHSQYSNYGYKYTSKNMAATTYIEIHYTNKKTKEKGTITYSLSKLINYVK